MKHGVRNSLLLAPMPTASTAQIMGNNEAFEPFTSNIYTRRTLSGEFVVVNKHLVKDLINLGMWNEDIKNLIIIHKGSVQNIPGIPDDIKEVYKTVWEIKQKDLLDMSADRGRFICQSQSMNLFIEGVNAAKLTAAHFHSWEIGLKTGMYYLRTKAAADALSGLGVDLSKYKDNKVETVNAPVIEKPQTYEAKRIVTALPEEMISVISNDLAEQAAKLVSDMTCSLDNPDECIACGS
jgi:ribonucleoside-diphosphate reductase alpha chain